MLVEKNFKTEKDPTVEITLFLKKSTAEKLEYLESIDNEIMDVMISNLYEKFKE